MLESSHVQLLKKMRSDKEDAENNSKEKSKSL